jgi:hypothetical protein
VSSLTPNQKVKLTLWRDRRAWTVELTVGEWARPR